MRQTVRSKGKRIDAPIRIQVAPMNTAKIALYLPFLSSCFLIFIKAIEPTIEPITPMIALVSGPNNSEPPIEIKASTKLVVATSVIFIYLYVSRTKNALQCTCLGFPSSTQGNSIPHHSLFYYFPIS